MTNFRQTRLRAPVRIFHAPDLLLEHGDIVRHLLIADRPGSHRKQHSRRGKHAGEDAANLMRQQVGDRLPAQHPIDVPDTEGNPANRDQCQQPSMVGRMLRETTGA